jgi:hypothetical protein
MDGNRKGMQFSDFGASCEDFQIIWKACQELSGNFSNTLAKLPQSPSHFDQSKAFYASRSLAIYTYIYIYIHTYMVTYRWFGMFSVFRGVAIGMALGVATTPISNSGTLLALYTSDLFIQVLFLPQNDWFANISEMFTSGVQVSQ